jgi:hypothetical protein
MGAQQQDGDTVLLGGERQATASRRIGSNRLTDDGGNARRPQALLQRPEKILLAPCRDHQQPRRIEPA